MGPDWGTVGTPVGSAALKLNGQDERDMIKAKELLESGASSHQEKTGNGPSGE